MSREQRLLERKEALIDALSVPRLWRKTRERLTLTLEALAIRLDDLETYTLDAWQTIAEQKELLRESRRRVRPGRLDPVMSTRLAIYQGRVASGNRITGEEIRQRVSAASKNAASVPVLRTKLPYARSADFPELDIRALAPGQGRAASFRLLWPASAEHPELDVVMHRDRQRGKLTIVFGDEGASNWAVQDIDVIAGARSGDHFLVCPVKRSRHLKLYFRDGRFASAVASKLLPPSIAERKQLKSGLAR